MASNEHPASSVDRSRQASEDRLVAIARICYDDRRLRTRYLPAGLFAEPAWDILLEAFLCEGRGHPLTVSSACVAADAPASTALRHLRLLEGYDLIGRHASAGDRRVVELALTLSGRTRMADYLHVLVKRRAGTVAEALAAQADDRRLPK